MAPILAWSKLLRASSAVSSACCSAWSAEAQASSASCVGRHGCDYLEGTPTITMVYVHPELTLCEKYTQSECIRFSLYAHNMSYKQYWQYSISIIMYIYKSWCISMFNICLRERTYQPSLTGIPRPGLFTKWDDPQGSHETVFNDGYPAW